MGRGVVYTTCIAGRDAALPRVQQRTAGADYVCFADHAGVLRHRGTSDWELRAAWPVDDCPTRTARFHKCCPHIVLPGYDWWIWVDCNTTLRGEMSELLTTELTLLSHSAGHTLQTEFDVVRSRYRAAPSLLSKQYAAYVTAGVPLDTPIPQTGLLARRNVGWICALNDSWWRDVERYTQRDQLAIVPALREHDVPIEYRSWAAAAGRLIDINYDIGQHSEVAYSGYQHQLGNADASDIAVAAAGAQAWYEHVHYDDPAPPPYRFVYDWTACYRRKLQTLAAAGFAPRNVLEIGIYEARGAVAAIEQFASLQAWTGADPWAGPHYSPLRDNAEWNLRQLRHRRHVDVRIFDTISDVVCRQLRQAEEQFDLVYIDGHHGAAAVLSDSRNAWALLRPGGIVVWDDIPWTPDGSTDTPVRTGLEQFLQEVGLTFDDANFDGWQCHLTKPA